MDSKTIASNSRRWRVLQFTAILAVLPVMLLIASSSWSADDQSDIAKRIDKSAQVLNEIMATPDKAIPDKVPRFRTAPCMSLSDSTPTV